MISRGAAARSSSETEDIAAAVAEVAEHSAELTVVVDSAGAVVYANPTALATFGISEEKAIGADAFAYLHPDDIERVRARLSDLLRSPRASVTDSVRFMSASGEVRALEIVATNCLDSTVVSGIVVNGRDVTERNEYIARLQASLDAITCALTKILELRDPYTAGHQRQVAHIAVAIARELRLSDAEIMGIEVAATIHDIGKIAIPTEILVFPGKLSDAELEIVKTHPQAGRDIVATAPFPWPVAEMILQHHERLDGSGYPRGLKGNAILLGSRILAVADVVSAMTEHRPYRSNLGIAGALAEVASNRGRLYDSAAVDACLHLFSEGRFDVMPGESGLTTPRWPVTSQPASDGGHIRVVIVDDHPMVADGLAEIVRNEPDLDVVGTAGSAADGIALVDETRPDVVIMDYRLPDKDGGSATRTILERWPDISVIMLTGSGAEEALASAIEAGCMGFLEKELGGAALADAIRRVNRGELVIHAESLHSALPHLERGPANPHELTAREFELLSMLASGSSTEKIASELYLSQHTVRNHIRNIIAKLGAHSKLEAVAIALRERVIELPVAPTPP